MKLFTILVALMLTGCNVFQAKVGPRIAEGVKRYCAEPVEARLLLRSEVNALTAPNSIRVECAADTPSK